MSGAGVPAVVEGHGDCTARAPSQSIMLGAGQGAAAGSNATHDVARKAAIAGAGAGSGGAETGAGSPSVRSPPSTAHASRECALPAPPAARAGTPAAGTSKQAQLAASFEAKSAQLLQQFVAFRSQRTLSTDDLPGVGSQVCIPAASCHPPLPMPLHPGRSSQHWLPALARPAQLMGAATLALKCAIIVSLRCALPATTVGMVQAEAFPLHTCTVVSPIGTATGSRSAQI